MRKVILCLITVAGFLGATFCSYAQKPKPPVRRAQPPKFESNGDFYTNAFSEGLSGTRPADIGKPVALATSNAAAGSSGNAAMPATGSAGSGAWATIISATALENEIKSQKLGADKAISTPTDFTSNGYKYTRREFTIAAMVFAIIAEYDGEVRFKKEALTARDTFARTASNSKVGTTGVYNEAKLRKQDLTDLLDGQSIEIKADIEPKANWVQICDRNELMKRLDINNEPKVKAWTSSKGEFTANLEALQQEAEIFNAIGHVLLKDGMESADDDTYKGYAKILQQGAADLVKACKDKDHDSASKAASVISQSCDKCHGDFR
jgi:hypothetical protein